MRTSRSVTSQASGTSVAWRPPTDAAATPVEQGNGPVEGTRARRLELHAVEWRLLLLAGDASAWWLAGAAAVALVHPPRFTVNSGPRSIVIEMTVLVAWLVWAWVNGAYHIDIASRLSFILPALARAATGQTLSFVALAFFARGFTGRVVWAWWLVAGFVLITAWRTASLSIFTLPIFSRRVLFAGTDSFLQELATITREKWAHHYRVLGYLHGSSPSSDLSVDGLALLGELRQLPELAERLHAGEVVVGREAVQDRTTLERLIDCRNRGIEVTPATELFEELTGQVPVDQVDHHWIMDLPNRAVHNRPYTALKRLVDIALAGIGLSVFAGLLPFIALAIWLDSGRPIFYQQLRSGLHGRSFALVKFRTMRKDAETNAARWALPGDARITRVGRVLRKVRLDELPQVINILRGDMTVVGPRPERPEFVTELEKAIPFYRTRLEVKPGLTGWAQINDGYGSSVEDAVSKLQYDLYYVKHQSVLLDALVILRTFGVLARFRGR